MEFAEKGDLEKLISKSKASLSEKKIWEMFFQIVAGLADLHSNNIFH
jgi:serine/threonine protein kinase